MTTLLHAPPDSPGTAELALLPKTSSLPKAFLVQQHLPRVVQPPRIIRVTEPFPPASVTKSCPP